MTIDQRIKIFIRSLIITLIAVRTYLFFFPSANLNIGKYNVHHLYIGAFLIIIVLIFFIFNIVNKFTVTIAGISSALVLDEIVYLIATDGSDAAYLTQYLCGVQ